MPSVSPPTRVPAWAGERGPELVRRTRRLSQRGKTTNEHATDDDPLRELTEHFAMPLRPLRDDARSFGDLERTTARIRVNRPSWGQRRLKFSALDKIASPHVSFTLNGTSVTTRKASEVDSSVFTRAYPMRDFARRLNQQNHPTAPWVETMAHLIGAESHHEGAFYLLADFHPLVTLIAGQPFTLSWPKGGTLQSHTPDCLLASSSHPRSLVVDVKDPVERAGEKWRAREAFVARTCADMGLAYMVWSGLPRRFRRNLENLAEARVPEPSLEAWGPAAREFARHGKSLRAVAMELDSRGYQYTWALTLVRRLLWLHDLETDLGKPLELDSEICSLQSRTDSLGRGAHSVDDGRQRGIDETRGYRLGFCQVVVCHLPG